MESDKRTVEPDLFENLAEDSLSLLRINLVLGGLYLSAFGLLSQAVGANFAKDTLNATYTQFAFHALFASMAASVLFYRKARRISTQQQVDEYEHFSEEMSTINGVTASAFASFGSVVCISLGIIEAFAGSAPPISFPILAIGFFVVLWILGPFSVLVIADKIAERSKHLRDLLYVFI